MLQPVQERVHPGAPFLGRQTPATVQDGFQRFALDVLHDDVRRPVGFQIPVRLHHVRMPETVDRPGLVQEAFETPGEGLLVRWRRGGNPLAVNTGRKLGREVLLEGDRPVELTVEGQVRDAEAAGSKNANDLVLGYAATRWQGGGLNIGHGWPLYPAGSCCSGCQTDALSAASPEAARHQGREPAFCS